MQIDRAWSSRKYPPPLHLKNKKKTKNSHSRLAGSWKRMPSEKPTRNMSSGTQWLRLDAAHWSPPGSIARGYR